MRGLLERTVLCLVLGLRIVRGGLDHQYIVFRWRQYVHRLFCGPNIFGSRVGMHAVPGRGLLYFDHDLRIMLGWVGHQYRGFLWCKLVHSLLPWDVQAVRF